MIDKDLESQVIAAMLSDQQSLDNGMAILKNEDFGETIYRKIFEHITTMYSKGQPIDAITVHQDMKEIVKGYGTTWMLLKDGFWANSTLDYSIRKLKELTKARKLSNLCQLTLQQLRNKESIPDILQNVENNIYSLSADTNEIKIKSPSEHAESMLQTLFKRMERKSNGGIKTSYKKLNYATNGGFLPGQLIILAAKTGKGKTAFALNLMRDIAIAQKQEALYINTEMGDEQIDCRFMALLNTDSGCNFTHSDIASGNITDEQSIKITKSLDKMFNSGFYSATVPDLTIQTLISIARRFKAQKQLKVLVVDYVGRMDTQDPRMKEYQVLKNIAKKLKTLAQELQITVIMLAQVTDDDKLEGAKAMKNECDLMAYLREMTQNELDKYTTYNYMLAIEKNRDGQALKIPLEFIGEKMTFRGEK